MRGSVSGSLDFFGLKVCPRAAPLLQLFERNCIGAVCPALDQKLELADLWVLCLLRVADEGSSDGKTIGIAVLKFVIGQRVFVRNVEHAVVRALDEHEELRDGEDEDKQTKNDGD